MKKTSSKNLSVINNGNVLEGIISSVGKLVIKGTVKGKITAENVVVAKEGVVYSEASVNNITIGGRFEGEMEVKGELTVLSTGTCAGRVSCKDLVVENGGILNAKVKCKM